MKNNLTSKIIKALYGVHNELGPGFLEQVYQNALRIVFEQFELQCEFEKKVVVAFRGQPIGIYFADLIVEDEVVLELKAVRELCPEHSAQLINYLKAGRYKTGLLVNFGAPKLEFKRLYS